MALLYRVVENFDPYAVPGANLVVRTKHHVISYNAQPNGQTTTLTIAFKDSGGAWLVGAEPAVMAQLPVPRVALQAWINALGLWRHWRIDGNGGESFTNVIEEVDLPSDVSSANPMDLGDGRFAIGGKATVASRLGSFRPSEIEVDTDWRGDHS